MPDTSKMTSIRFDDDDRADIAVIRDHYRFKDDSSAIRRSNSTARHRDQNNPEKISEEIRTTRLTCISQRYIV